MIGKNTISLTATKVFCDRPHRHDEACPMMSVFAMSVIGMFR